MKASIFVLLFLIFTFPVFAQQEQPGETYADTDMLAPTQGIEKPSGFHGRLGAGFFTAKRIFGDNHLLVNTGPVILLRYEDIAYWSLTGGGVWIAQTADHSLRFGAGIRSRAGWNPGFDPYRQGMADRDGTIDGYLNAVWNTSLMTVGAHYYHHVLGGGKGDTASLRISRRFALGEDLWLIPSTGAEWQSGERVDYYYGVRPAEVLPTRPAYAGTRTINADIGLAGLYRLSRSWSLIGGVFETRYGDSIAESPIVTMRYQTLYFLGAGWTF